MGSCLVLGYLATIAAVTLVRTAVKSWQPKLCELHLDVVNQPATKTATAN